MTQASRSSIPAPTAIRTSYREAPFWLSVPGRRGCRSPRNSWTPAGAPISPSAPTTARPRRYRGLDFVWWLGVLGKWEAQFAGPGKEHVTIAVSGADGGHTVDFRTLAAKGMTLLGVTQSYRNGVLVFAPDLADNIARGDADYLSVLDEADAYALRNGLDLPDDLDARQIGPEPHCVTDPILKLDLAEAGITAIIWTTGYSLDFGWLKVDAFDKKGKPRHQRGISSEPGVYFLGLPWLSRRGSSFIWGVWHDAKFIADQIAIQRDYMGHFRALGPVDS